jgi:hypothetical protein
MLSFHDAAAIAAAPQTVSSDPVLQKLIADRVHDWTATDLLGLTHLVVIQPGDIEEAIIDEVAFSPLINPIDGERFGSRTFEPGWDWLEHHDGCWELIMTVADSGFAFVIFVIDNDGVDPELRRLCQTYAPATGQ